MKLIHSTETDLDALPAELRDSMLANNWAMSVDLRGGVEIYFTEQQWLDLITEHGMDQYFDDEDLGRPWWKSVDDPEVAE